MSALDSLRDKALAAAALVRDAEAAHQRELEAAKGRNVVRRAEFWSDAAERITVLVAAAETARQAVLAELAAGRVAVAMDEYAEYRLRHIEWVQFSRTIGNAVRFDTDQAGNRVEALPDRLNVARTGYPPGCTPAPGNSTPVSWESLRDQALTEREAAHAVAYKADQLAPLRDQLESEDGSTRPQA